MSGSIFTSTNSKTDKVLTLMKPSLVNDIF
jgi:hypothetical protein